MHEGYLRLIGDAETRWKSRGHFFASDAEAMRRILVEAARRKLRQKHGGDRQRVELRESNLATTVLNDRLLAIDEALDRLSADDACAAELVKLRFFGGFCLTEAAEIVGLSRTNAYEQWA